MFPRPILITTALNGAERIQGANSSEQGVFLVRDRTILHLVYNSRTPNGHDRRRDTLSFSPGPEERCFDRENGKRRLRSRAVV